MYKIETNVPIPTPVKQDNKTKYPFKMMKVGNSFLAPKNKIGSLNTLMRLNKKRNGWEFMTKEVGNEVRVWRTK